MRVAPRYTEVPELPKSKEDMWESLFLILLAATGVLEKVQGTFRIVLFPTLIWVLSGEKSSHFEL